MKSTVVLVNGMPGTGKTTLSQKLAADLELPLFSKDEIKEFVSDKLKVTTQAEAKAIGAAAIEMTYLIMNGYAKQGISLLVECPLFHNYARPVIEKIVNDYDVNLVEVYCKTDKSIRRDRIAYRAHNSDRHYAHLLSEVTLNDNDPEPTDYEPIQLGTLLQVDTTNFDDAEYNALLNKLKLKV
jgi:predicted kinase